MTGTKVIADFAKFNSLEDVERCTTLEVSKLGKLNIIGIRGVGIPVLDSGILKGFVGTAMDVTSHQELMHELVRREGYLAEAQRLSHTGSFGWRVASGESPGGMRPFSSSHSTKK